MVMMMPANLVGRRGSAAGHLGTGLSYSLGLNGGVEYAVLGQLTAQGGLDLDRIAVQDGVEGGVVPPPVQTAEMQVMHLHNPVYLGQAEPQS